MNKSASEILVWSIGLPGFGQILNRQFLKGIFFVLLELIVNVQAKFNHAIFASFNGDIQTAIDQTNYQWLMFFPCLYFFTMWDAYKDAKGGDHSPFLFLPFVISAYFVTVSVMYSQTMTVFGVLWGPVFLPILFVIPALIIGFLIKTLLTHLMQKRTVPK